MNKSTKSWGSWAQKILLKVFPQVKQVIVTTTELIKGIRADLKKGDVEKAMEKIDKLLDTIGDILNPNK